MPESNIGYQIIASGEDADESDVTNRFHMNHSDPTAFGHDSCIVRLTIPPQSPLRRDGTEDWPRRPSLILKYCRKI